MLNKIRALLCQEWSLYLFSARVFIIVMGLAGLGARLATNHPLFIEALDYVAAAIWVISMATALATILAIQFFRWQFRREFGCDAPRKEQAAARKALQSRIDSRLTHLAAAKQAIADYAEDNYERTLIHSPIEGEACSRVQREVANFLNQQGDQADKKYTRAAELAQAFCFTVEDSFDSYVEKMREQNKKIFTSTQPASPISNEG